MTRPLSKSEQEQADVLIDTIRGVGEVHPKDFVDEWKAKPDVRRYELVEEYETTVPVNRIVGTEPINTDRLVKKRLVRVLAWLRDGKYDQSQGLPPHLAMIDGEYYVSSDGNHRVLAHKMLGLDEIQAEVSVYKPSS